MPLTTHCSVPKALAYGKGLSTWWGASHSTQPQLVTLVDPRMQVPETLLY